MNAWLATIPSTNLRIAVTLVLAAGTAANYWWTQVPPDNGWLTWLAVMAGIDVLQFGAKRATYVESPPAQPDVEDSAATDKLTREDAEFAAKVLAGIKRDEEAVG